MSSLAAQRDRPGVVSKPIRPIRGALVLAGHGKIPSEIQGAFVNLCGGASADVVIVSKRISGRATATWKKRGARSVQAIAPTTQLTEPQTIALLGAEGVWFEEGAEDLQANTLLRALVDNVLARGGAIGSQGASTVALAAPTITEEQKAKTQPKASGWGLLPGSRVHLLKSEDPRGTNRALDKVVTPGDGMVSWQIPKSTALVVHARRRVCALGKGVIQVLVPDTEAWPARRRTIEPMPKFAASDPLDYEVDLLSWIRSARDRTGPLFPPQSPRPPKITRGTLILSGGGGVQSPTWRRFLEAAGGKDAQIVCIPTAAGITPGQTPSSYSAGQLHSHGAERVDVLHLVDVERANRDPALRALETAGGVWIDGGRTYNVIDAYQHTRVHALIRQVLERGGVVGGSSAGCQVLGDFLVRGDPRTNKTLAFEGYTTGLGLLPGVVLDAHFVERNRHEPFVGLMKLYPQLLGIGIDADTALVVTGSTAEVMGRSTVSFYDAAKELNEPAVLAQGQRYDLVRRVPRR